MKRGGVVKFGLRPWALVGYFVLLVVAAAIAIAAQDAEMRVVNVEAVLPGFYTHVSNLLISAGLILAYGVVRLVTGARFPEIAIFALLVVAANYGYELFLTLWNTLDIVDAHYGAAASVLCLAYLAAVQRFGLKPAQPKHPKVVEDQVEDVVPG